MRLHLTSPLLQTLPVRHGFSARTGGVSEGAFASLNLGRAVGDELSAVEENHRRLADSIGYDGARLFETSQVHGATVRRIVAADESANVRAEEADALVTNVPATAIGVRVADCLPILLADREAGVVGAVHAGWRGAAANIAPIAIDEMIALGASPTRIHAALGPHIRECCFEVGREVVDALRNVAHGAACTQATGCGSLQRGLRGRSAHQRRPPARLVARPRGTEVAGAAARAPDFARPVRRRRRLELTLT